MKKVLNTILTVFLVIVLVVVSLLSVIMILSANNDGVANIFGYSPIVILDTKSMEPTLTSNDMIIVKQQEKSVQLEKGQIISFWGIVDNRRSIVTHRIHDVVEFADGGFAYETKGDHNPGVDPVLVTSEDVIGVYVTKIGGMGAFLNFIKTPTGILVCMVIPIALIFLWQLYRVIMMALAVHREAQAKKTAEMSEDEKQRVIEEYLRSQQQAAASENETQAVEATEEKTETAAEADSTDTQTTAE